VEPGCDGDRGVSTSPLSTLVAVVGGPPQRSIELLAAMPPGTVGKLVAAAREHGVEAWLAGYAPLADPAWRELAEQRPRFLAAQVRALALAREFGALMAAEGLPWAVVKGPAIAYGIYPRPDLRHSVDLDLLVDPTDFPSVLDMLADRGFQLLDRNWPLIEEQRPAELRVRSPRGVLVDLHWSLINPAATRAAFRLPTAELLARRQLLDPPGIPVLSQTDQLVHLGLHGAHSGGNRLNWLTDLHLAAQRVLDWSDIVRRARAAGAGPALSLMLTRCQRVFGTGLPPEVAASLGGEGWRLLMVLDRHFSLPVDPVHPAFARSLARSTRSGAVRTLIELGRHGAVWVRSGRLRPAPPSWTDPESVHSALHDVPDPMARSRYLQSVRQCS
jgi:hypothetical protein